MQEEKKEGGSLLQVRYTLMNYLHNACRFGFVLVTVSMRLSFFSSMLDMCPILHKYCTYTHQQLLLFLCSIARNRDACASVDG